MCKLLLDKVELVLEGGYVHSSDAVPGLIRVPLRLWLTSVLPDIQVLLLKANRQKAESLSLSVFFPVAFSSK